MRRSLVSTASGDTLQFSESLSSSAHSMSHISQSSLTRSAPSAYLAYSCPVYSCICASYLKHSKVGSGERAKVVGVCTGKESTAQHGVDGDDNSQDEHREHN